MDSEARSQESEEKTKSGLPPLYSEFWVLTPDFSEEVVEYEVARYGASLLESVRIREDSCRLFPVKAEH